MEKGKDWISKRIGLRFKNLEFQFQNSLNINKLPQKFNSFDSWGVWSFWSPLGSNFINNVGSECSISIEKTALQLNLELGVGGGGGPSNFIVNQSPNPLI